jgi:hypothetical protein
VNVNARLYRAKARECVSLAENMNDPERRADMLRFARVWLSLTEPIGDLPIPRSPYELPRPRYSSGTDGRNLVRYLQFGTGHASLAG